MRTDGGVLLPRLQLGQDLLRQSLAEFHAHLIVAVDAPDDALCENQMWIKNKVFSRCIMPAMSAAQNAAALRADSRRLAGLPPALIQTAECGVLRDESEAYALLQASQELKAHLK